MTASNQSDGDPLHPGWFFLLLGAAFLASLGVFLFVEGGVGDVDRLRGEKQSLLRHNERQRERYRDLVRRRKRLHHDPYLIEELAREKLGLHTPGEQVVRRESRGDTRPGSPGGIRGESGSDSPPARKRSSESLPR